MTGMWDRELAAKARGESDELMAGVQASADRLDALELRRNAGWPGETPMGPMAYTSYTSDTWEAMKRDIALSRRLCEAAESLLRGPHWHVTEARAYLLGYFGR